MTMIDLVEGGNPMITFPDDIIEEMMQIYWARVHYFKMFDAKPIVL